MPRPLQYNFLALLFLGMLLAPRPAQATPTADKFAHYGVSFAATTAAFGVLKLMIPKAPRWRLVVVAASATLVAGLTKELLVDPQADPWDMAANAAGAASAATCILTFSF